MEQRTGISWKCHKYDERDVGKNGILNVLTN